MKAAGTQLRMANPSLTHPAGDEPIAALVRQVAEQTATLARQEVRLAELELKEKGKRAGLGAGLLGMAGVVGLFALAALLAAAGAALALVLPVWAAALGIAGLALVVSGGAALTGRSRLQAALPPAPVAAEESVRQDIATVKESARR